MTKARIERQSDKVARLTRELRFELLLLRRMRARGAERVSGGGPVARCHSVAEVYAAALARREGETG